jgi:hypothetical protein
VGLRAGLDIEAIRKILWPCRGSNPGRAKNKYSTWASILLQRNLNVNLKKGLQQRFENVLKWSVLEEVRKSKQTPHFSLTLNQKEKRGCSFIAKNSN